MKIQRYSHYGVLGTDPMAKCCKDEDVAKLEAENEKLLGLLFKEWCRYTFLDKKEWYESLSEDDKKTAFNIWYEIEQKLKER